MPSPPLRVRFVGHLTRAQLEQALGALVLPAQGRVGLLVDCREMHGYDLEARHGFVEWNRAASQRIGAVAIVTDHTMWGMVIRAMSLAARMPIRPFPTPEAAEQFLASAV